VTAARIARDALYAYQIILFARILMSWFPHPPDSLRPVFRFVYSLTEPVLRLVRPLIPPFRIGGGAMDLSPLLVFVLLAIGQHVLSGYA